MADGEMHEFRPESKRQSKQTRLPIYLAVSLVLLSVVVVAVVIALIWRFAAVANGLDNLTVTCEESDVVIKYPGFFRTPTQQSDLEMILSDISDVPANTFRPTNCTIDCPFFNYKPLRKRRKTSIDFIEYVQNRYRYQPMSRTKRQNSDEPPVYNGCCESSKKYTAPDTATDVNGNIVTLVQLDGYKQYFVQETCVTVPSCSICTCAQPTPFVNEAVVYKDKDAKKPKDKYEQVYIQFPGCCKCLNINSQT